MTGVAEGVEPPPQAEAPRRRVRIRAEHVRDYGVLVGFAALFIALSVDSGPFLTPSNLLNILYENAPLGIVACAVTLVVVAGNFDLSLGTAAALCEVCAAWVANHWGAGLGLVAPLVVGGGCGLVNGLLRTKLRINSFLATLATSFVFYGAATAISGGLLITQNSPTFLALGQDSVGTIQYSVFVFVGLAAILQFVLARSVFGRFCYAAGGNRDAARLSGIRVDRIVIATFVIAGIAAGIAGLINASATGSGNNNDFPNLALQAIAAVAIGGTSIYGGVGAVWRTVVGVLFLALITNGLDLLSVNSDLQPVITGAVIVAAVATSSLAERR
jgi:ribose transport system permease protein